MVFLIIMSDHYFGVGRRSMLETDLEYLENLATLLAEAGGAINIPRRTGDLASQRSPVQVQYRPP